MEMEKDKIVFKGSHPDSLYRVPTDSGAGAGKLARALRMLRWPVALIAICVALAVFVYFLMPDNLEASLEAENGTYWEPVVAAGHRPQVVGNPREHFVKKPESKDEHGAKTSEIDFYANENSKYPDVPAVVDTITESKPTRKLPAPPVFPTHLTPEVQYGNEKADTDNTRKPKLWEDVTSNDFTLKPHITQKPEKPLAIYFKDDSTAITTTAETITRAETFNDVTKFDQTQVTNKVDEATMKTYPSVLTNQVDEATIKTYPSVHKEYASKENEHLDRIIPLEVQEYIGRRPPPTDDVNFTSGHSKLFGISIEDAEKMKSTTQSSLYNTRVSPTLPTWRDGDDTTTKKYPTNIYTEVQCRSTRLALCRGVLPYDLAGAPAKIGNVEFNDLLPQIDYLVATNCSARVRHFVCALLEPECNPPPYPTKMPCYGLCKAIVDSCDGQIPSELTPAFNCKQYARSNCVGAKTPCYPREFGCSDGSCIPRDWICDGTKDCSTGEDEATCVQCDKTEYRCGSGGCILKRWLCDGYADCPDGEDEQEVTCGARDVHTTGDTREPEEEPAGSAPAPAIRRPNRVPIGRKAALHRTGENDSSKELLVTSDSNNALKRNFTRRPLPSRLSHYYRPQSRTNEPEPPKETTTEQIHKQPEIKKQEAEKTTQKIVLENESIEDVNMGDLGFFDEFEKEGKDQANPPVQKAPHRKFGGVPPPSPPVLQAATQTTRLDKSGSKFDRVIDGAALLRKAAAEQAADAAEDLASLNDTYVDDVPVDAPATSSKKSSKNPLGSAQDAGRSDAARPSDAGNAPESYRKTENAAMSDPADRKRGGARGTYGKPGDWSSSHASPCPSGELRCVDGRCITLAQLCDGTIDCSDHADEDNCYT